MTTTKRAFLFDLNGTMIDDMDYHITAWSGLLNETLNAGMSREAVREQMYGKNSELFERVFGGAHFTEQEMEKLSRQKEEAYQKIYKPHLALIRGLDVFLEAARQHHIAMAIGSAAIPFNIDFVLDNLNLRHYFSAIVSANDVRVSKPDPETFLKAAELLGVDPARCVVFEDAPKGVEAASNAGMPAVVLTTLHEPKEFAAYSNVLRFAADYTDPFLERLLIG